MAQNYTPISSGAAADHTTFNNPLDELDDAIGADVSTLTTTAKTLVGAVNEVDADMGAAASTLTTTAKNLVGAVNEIDAQVDAEHNANGTHKTSAITNTYLATDVKVGSLAALTTVNKSSVSAAMIELMAYISRMRGSDYSELLISTLGAGLQAYWPLWDVPELAAAADISGNARNGVPNGVYYGRSGYNYNSAQFAPGLVSYVDIYAALNSWFTYASGNRDEGTITALVKMRDVSIWSDGLTHSVFSIYSNGSNLISIAKLTTSGRLEFSHKAGAQNHTLEIDGNAMTDWFQVGMSWSVSNNEAYFTINGHRYGAVYTNPDRWANLSISSTRCLIGAQQKTALHHDGYIQHVAISNAYTSQANMRLLGLDPILPLFFGDSITTGVGATDTAHSWVALMAAARGWRTYRNAGVSGTVLQNTTQNTVTTIGGAVTGNGQDNLATRVTAYNPDLVYILYGLNDLRLDDAAFTAAAFGTSLGAVVDAIVAGGTSAANIIIGSPPLMTNYSADDPYNGGTTQRQSDYRDQCAAVATAKGTKYADVYQAMVNGGGADLVAADGIHPNDAGHALIAATMLAAV